jgi:hypothetical protein
MGRTHAVRQDIGDGFDALGGFRDEFRGEKGAPDGGVALELV